MHMFSLQIANKNNIQMTKSFDKSEQYFSDLTT
jgi:hypothetical protein